MHDAPLCVYFAMFEKRGNLSGNKGTCLVHTGLLSNTGAGGIGSSSAHMNTDKRT